jgi:hypothetical protein
LAALRRKQLEDAAEAYQVGGLYYETLLLWGINCVTCGKLQQRDIDIG